MRVTRPVVRSFKIKYAQEAVKHVRRGGHAIVWEDTRRATLVFRPPPDAENTGDFGEWAVLDLGKQRWDLPKKGPFRGLATTLVPPAQLFVVKRWIERDSAWPESTRNLQLDCLKCGSCCKDNEVILETVDKERFRNAGRADLLKTPYSRKANGKLVLTLLASKDCRHLGRDNKCGIYAIRPDSCSTFPPGSECCLYAREAEMKIYDGVAPGG